MIADAASSAEGAERSSEARGRRRFVLCLPVLVPLAFLSLSYEHLYWLWRGNHIVGRTVAAGETASYGQSQWRLKDVAEQPHVKGAAIPAGFTLLVVDLSVRVGSARSVTVVGETEFEELWGACRVRMEDATGRTWEAANLGYLPDLYPPSDSSIQKCRSHSLEMPPPQSELTVRETILVPQHVARSVTPTLSVDGEQPLYLRFARK